ncbi:MAG: tetratricopeptide repeat protein [Acidimicrobiia bacterium]|jgi:tetratricopeptide (TPR) repeat protein
MISGFDDRLAVAISLREEGRDDEAREMLLDLHAERPDHAEVNLQCAWVHDKLGLEALAVPFYEKAIESGLAGNGLRDALLGLGSSYRALGHYEKALATLTRAVEAYPEDNALAVFRSMALYNNGRGKEACETLIRVLIATTSDEHVERYRTALAEYAEDLDRIWP